MRKCKLISFLFFLLCSYQLSAQELVLFEEPVIIDVRETNANGQIEKYCITLTRLEGSLSELGVPQIVLDSAKAASEPNQPPILVKRTVAYKNGKTETTYCLNIVNTICFDSNGKRLFAFNGYLYDENKPEPPTEEKMRSRAIKTHPEMIDYNDIHGISKNGKKHFVMHRYSGKKMKKYLRYEFDTSGNFVRCIEASSNTRLDDSVNGI